jgi:precorrin-2 dehydrogenase/sirohydrochlorin ferrochelatase
MLNLEGRGCVVVGGGEVAARKVSGLLAAGALVTVISPVLHPDLEQLATDNAVIIRRMAFAPGMLFNLSMILVFAATDSPSVNRRIAEEARALGALVEIADLGADGDFHNMAAIHRGPVTIAVSTGGASPALSAHLRGLLEQAVGNEYGMLATWMAELRPQVRQSVHTQSDRAALWNRVLTSSILDDLRRGDTSEAHKTFDALVNEALRKG